MDREKKKKYILEIVREECKGCGRCIDVCPKSVIVMGDTLNHLGFPYAIYKGEGCIGCGACFYNCPEPGAVTIMEEDEVTANE